MGKDNTGKISSIEEQIKQLENQKRQLIQKQREDERKARNHRLCKRGGLWESLLPDTITLTDEQFKTFLEKTVMTPFARKILADLKTNDEETATEKHIETMQLINTDTNQNKDNGTGATG